MQTPILILGSGTVTVADLRVAACSCTREQAVSLRDPLELSHHFCYQVSVCVLVSLFPPCVTFYDAYVTVV